MSEVPEVEPGWVTPHVAARIIGVSERTVQRSLGEDRPAWRRAWWGERAPSTSTAGPGQWWTVRATERPLRVVSRVRAEQIAAGPPPVPKG